MMGYFENTLPDYVTRGVAEHIDQFIIMLLVKMLADMKDSGVEPDYLQVYKLTYNSENNILSVHHSQEVPPYEKTLFMELPENVKAYEGKLYFIDDIQYKTILLAEEY